MIIQALPAKIIKRTKKLHFRYLIFNKIRRNYVKNLKKQSIAIALAMVICLVFASTSAFALEQDTAGNASASSESITTQKVDSDLYWAGDTTNISQTEVGGDIIAAGNSIETNSTNVAGNVRAAANSLVFNSTKIAKNATVAGNTVRFGQGTSVNGLYIAASDASFYGTAKCLHIASSTAIIDGTVEGDVEISAATVVVGDNAKITGKLKISSSTEPSISQSASINAKEISVNSGAMAGLLTGITAAFMIALVVVILSTLVMSVLIAALLKRPVNASAEMFQTSPAGVLITGFVSIIVAPLVCVLLLVFTVTIPLSIALICAIIALLCVAVPFTCAAVGKMLFKNMNSILSALIIAAIAGVLTLVPFVGPAVSVFSTMYLFGYCVRALFFKVKADNANNPVVPPANPTTPNTPQQ